jgi:hypothetical protein
MVAPPSDGERGNQEQPKEVTEAQLHSQPVVD